MSQFRCPDTPAYLIDTSTLCRGLRAFSPRAAARLVAHVAPASALLDAWLTDDEPVFHWLYSEDTIAEYHAVLVRLGLSTFSIDRVIGIIVQRGLGVVPPAGSVGSPDARGDIFFAAVEAAGDAALVACPPARVARSGRFRVLSPEEALAGLGRHVGRGDPGTLRLAGDAQAGPFQRWPG